MLVYRRFYYKSDGITGVIGIKCPDITCSYFTYRPLPPLSTLNADRRIAVYDYLLIRLHNEHPDHYCHSCKRVHAEGECT